MQCTNFENVDCSKTVRIEDKLYNENRQDERPRVVTRKSPCTNCELWSLPIVTMSLILIPVCQVQAYPMSRRIHGTATWL
mmetsp:Transcript_149056/g.277799  ORF Transcript_149056/g.277799 Transcript_149056/m.277799 type:complete len:80 (-) Transcript_149056:399-638(-)